VAYSGKGCSLLVQVLSACQNDSADGFSRISSSFGNDQACVFPSKAAQVLLQALPAAIDFIGDFAARMSG
jgi:hypothetical protein